MKVIVNIDGSSRGNPGPAAAGMVITGGEGGVIATKSEFLVPNVTNNFAQFNRQ